MLTTVGSVDVAALVVDTAGSRLRFRDHPRRARRAAPVCDLCEACGRCAHRRGEPERRDRQHGCLDSLPRSRSAAVLRSPRRHASVPPVRAVRERADHEGRVGVRRVRDLGANDDGLCEERSACGSPRRRASSGASGGSSVRRWVRRCPTGGIAPPVEDESNERRFGSSSLDRVDRSVGVGDEPRGRLPGPSGLPLQHDQDPRPLPRRAAPEIARVGREGPGVARRRVGGGRRCVVRRARR